MQKTLTMIKSGCMWNKYIVMVQKMNILYWNGHFCMQTNNPQIIHNKLVYSRVTYCHIHISVLLISQICLHVLSPKGLKAKYINFLPHISLDSFEFGYSTTPITDLAIRTSVKMLTLEERTG